MKSNTQNAKIEAITEKTLVLGIDVGSEMHYASKGQILRSTPNTAPLICGACNTQPEGLSTMA